MQFLFTSSDFRKKYNNGLVFIHKQEGFCYLMCSAEFSTIQRPLVDNQENYNLAFLIPIEHFHKDI